MKELSDYEKLSKQLSKQSTDQTRKELDELIELAIEVKDNINRTDHLLFRTRFFLLVFIGIMISLIFYAFDYSNIRTSVDGIQREFSDFIGVITFFGILLISTVLLRRILNLNNEIKSERYISRKLFSSINNHSELLYPHLPVTEKIIYEMKISRLKFH